MAELSGQWLKSGATCAENATMKREHIALGASGIRPIGRRAAALLVVGVISLAASPGGTSASEADDILLATALAPSGPAKHELLLFDDSQPAPYKGDRWYAALARSLSSITESVRGTRIGPGYPPVIGRPAADGPFRLELPLQLQVTADFEGTLARDRYSRSVRGSDPPDLRGLDWTLEANVGLSRSITKRTRIEVGWRVVRNRSNFEFYHYDRSIWGIYIRTKLD